MADAGDLKSLGREAVRVRVPPPVPSPAVPPPPPPADPPPADPFQAVQRALDHSFSDAALLRRALTHSSFANEAPRSDAVRDNETFEFFGDSLLGFLVAELLFEAYPDFREGALSKAKAHLVSEGHFARLARALGLQEALLLAAGESRTGGRLKDSILADAFEAVFAALYLDAGLDAARRLARRLFSDDVAALDPAELSFHDYKTTLQEIAQAEGRALPEYRLVAESGPDHAKTFVFEVRLDDALRASGEGPSKKEAQRQAAKGLLARLRGGRATS